MERKPSDDAWTDLCASLGVHLVWPSTFDILGSSKLAASSLEVWSQDLDASVDPSLTEPASGGPDTDARE